MEFSNKILKLTGLNILTLQRKKLLLWKTKFVGQGNTVKWYPSRNENPSLIASNPLFFALYKTLSVLDAFFVKLQLGNMGLPL